MVQRPGPVKVRDRPISKQIKLKVNELINRACQRQLRRVICCVNVQRPLVDVDPCNRVEPNTELFRNQTNALGKSARRAEQINEPTSISAVTAAINNRRANTLKKPRCCQIIVKRRRRIRQLKHGRRASTTNFNLANQTVTVTLNRRNK